jgi:hypothetical protein
VSLPDILELLLPGLPDEHREHVRRLTTALRLGAHAGRGVRAADIATNVEAARAELCELARRRRVDALCALLHHHLATHLERGSFLPWGEAAADLDGAWRALLEDGAQSPSVPAPGEPALEVAHRLFQELLRADVEGRSVRIWGLRLRRAVEGPEAGERAARELCASAERFAERRAAVAEVAASLLERGAVGEARAWLREHAALAAADDELAWHLAWCELLTGNEAQARAVVRGLEPYAGVLPRALAALRAKRPEWLGLLPGREPAPRVAGPPGGEGGAPAAALERRAFGASVLAAFALGPANEAIPVHLSAGAALRDKTAAWARGRDGAAADHAAPEHLLVAGARTLVRHAGPGASPASSAAPALSGVLDPRTRAHVLIPVHFAHGALEGEVAGWVALELPHHLVPEEARLQALAAAWSGRILEEAWARRGRAAEAAPALASEPGAGALDRDDPRVRAASAFVAELGMKVQQRRWWFFDVAHGGRALVATGGGALREPDGPAGRAHAVARAIATGGAIAFDEPEPRLALHAHAASGLAVPVRGPRGVVAVLAVESTRRRDFSGRDRARLGGAARGLHDRWLAARFAAWHRAQHGEEVFVDARLESPAAVRDVLAAGRARMPIAVVGPPGAGRRVLARWLAFEGGADASQAGGGASVPREVDLAGGLADARIPAESAEAFWIVSGLAGAPLERQATLLDAVEAAGARLIAILRGAPGALEAPQPGLAPRLERRLSRLVLRVAPLAARRGAIPELARLLLRRTAAEEGLAPAALDDAAIALLWRQPWPGNVRELERVLARLALDAPGAEVGADAVRAAAERAGVELARKLPSRHPARRDVVAALETTRCGSGAWNKTRAASYLGWDPDTLVARMGDLRVPSEPPPEARGETDPAETEAPEPE